jgi:undecaprenyl-diphosphatase
MITFSDQISGLFKEWLARPRPTHEPGLSGVHTVCGYSGGLYGFYSGHASTTMAIAIFFILLMKERYGFMTLLLLLWPLFMSYTRIYLGVHYPGDVLFGMMMGGMIGYLTARLCQVFLRKITGNRIPHAQ